METGFQAREAVPEGSSGPEGRRPWRTVLQDPKPSFHLFLSHECILLKLIFLNIETFASFF